MKYPRSLATLAISAVLLSGCTAASATASPPPTQAPTAAPTQEPTPTPTLKPTPAPTALFGPTDTIVVGDFQLKIAKATASATAWKDLSTGLGTITVVVGSMHYSSTTGWSPVIPTGMLVGVRLTVSAGSIDDLAKLAVSVKDANASAKPVDVAITSADSKTVLWFFAVGAKYAGPSMLVFPTGETVDLGV